MERDGLVERNGLGNAAHWDTRRGAPWESRGRSPPARFGNFSAVKSSPPEANKACRVCALPSNRPASGGFGPRHWPLHSCQLSVLTVGARIARPFGRIARGLSQTAAAKAHPCVRGGGAQRRRGCNAVLVDFRDNPPVMACAMTAPLRKGGLWCGGTNGLPQPSHPP